MRVVFLSCNFVSCRSVRKNTQYLVKWRDLSYTYATWENLGEGCGLKGVGQAIKAYENLRLLMDPRKKDKKDRKRGRRSKVTTEVRIGGK